MLPGNIKSGFVIRTITAVLTMLVALAFILLHSAGASQITNSAPSSTRIIINGHQTYEQVLFLNDTSYLPVRTISEVLGLKAEWDQSTNTIVLTSESSGIPDNSYIGQEGLYGVWSGRYIASQGETGVNISFSRAENGLESAEFEMFPVESNPQVPKGKFKMDVIYNNQTKEVEMKGTEWLEKPDNYDVVDLIGIVDGSSMRGVVTYKSKVVGRFNILRKPV